MLNPVGQTSNLLQIRVVTAHHIKIPPQIKDTFAVITYKRCLAVRVAGQASGKGGFHFVGKAECSSLLEPGD